MGDPNFLNRKFALIIRPAIVLLNSLTEMMKLTSWAVLFVRGDSKFQILATVPYRAACAVLDMESDSICAPSNADGYSLYFFLNTWFHHLRDLIMQEPFSSLYMFKKPGSIDLCCLVGSTQQVIRLGSANFFKSNPLHMDDHPCYVRVTMRSEQFREFIQSLASIHDHTVSFAVQLRITRETISWVTPSAGHFDHLGEGCEVEGLEEGAIFKFGMRWDLPLFQMLCSASVGSDRVVLSVFRNSLGEKFYGFRFLLGVNSFSFTYMELEFVPLH